MWSVSLRKSAPGPEIEALNGSESGEGLPLSGDVVGGKYRIGDVLGSGGMGVVTSGIHLDLGHHVAIKFLKSELASEPDALARFLREARAAASMTSPHATRIYDVGATKEGVPYIVMERLHGQGVDTLLEAGPLPVEMAVRIIVQTADALDEAHALGIVHRDLKPSNLFLASTPAGGTVVKVLDFGISKRLGEVGNASASLTAPHTLLGSPQYMSPEQLRDPSSVDRMTDIWALGVTLYELLVGQPPFDADSIPELYALILTKEHTRVSKVRREVPQAVADIVDRCLAEAKANRPVDMAAIVGAIIHLCPDDVGTRAHALMQRTSAKTYAPAARSKRRAALATVLAVLVVCLGGLLAVARSSSPRQAPGHAAALLPPIPEDPTSAAPVAREVDPAVAPPVDPAAEAAVQAGPAAKPDASPSPPPAIRRVRDLRGIKLLD